MLEFDWDILRNAIDILIVAYLIYRGLLVIKGTRAAPMLAGLAVVVLVYFISRPLGLNTVAWLLGNFLSSIILIVIVIFQDEIRRGLTKMGLQPVFGRFSKPLIGKAVEEISLACARLSKERIGALIVIQRDVGLDEFVEEGVYLDANLDRKLLYSLFVKESPLHDGAVVIEGGKIKAAGCVLPLSFNPDLDPNLGTRHRAALGLSERSDAVIVVVSEESGGISLVREGRLSRNLDSAMLRDALHRLIATEDQDISTEEVGEKSRA
ncbi:MAG: TIGR00159 family protein [Candidatus Dadabacteria bacterium]|nr:MAG: TIGR00159 family protein [Candidatus Dadabacteria bacterium]